MSNNVLLNPTTYDQFITANHKNKYAYETLGHIEDVNFQNNTCALRYLDRYTPNLPIASIVNDTVWNCMGAVSNPSALKGWKGWSK